MRTTPQHEHAAAHAAGYEQLRRHLVDGQLTCDRLGVALVLREGLASWLEQWSKLPVPTALSAAATSPAAALPKLACTEVVQVLSAMALSHMNEIFPIKEVSA